jgi:hypothetical protein
MMERATELNHAGSELLADIQKTKKTEDLLRKPKEGTKEANKKISMSERKYRLLVDESNDLIFSLKEDFSFIAVNKAILSHLQVDPASVRSLNFMDLLYDGPYGRQTPKKLVRAKLDRIVRVKRPIEFVTDFKSAFTTDPLEMLVKLEYLDIEGKNEIHGIATPIIEDILLKDFIYEKQKFTIGNYLIYADDIARYMSRNLLKIMQRDEVSMIKLGLREIIINAIEHGNLEITYNEKTEAINNNSYAYLIAERRNDPQHADKIISIEYEITPQKAEFIITDQGDGFDHQMILNSDINIINEGSNLHGRGILITKEIFDEVKYNDMGNQVILIKYLNKSTG